jgi:predicted ATPase
MNDGQRHSLDCNNVRSLTNNLLFVITGGPGAGKTTVLHELTRRGFACVPEVARQIIREQMGSNGDALPWGNTARYAELMMERSVARYRENLGCREPRFLDRGIPDTLCYAGIIGLDANAIVSMRQTCETYRYNQRAIITPPWEQIYTTDGERKQTFAEAVDVYGRMAETYRDCGYELIQLPKISPRERADFILRRLEL